MHEMLVVDPEALKAWRIRLGLEQTQLAKLANMHQSRVSAIETRVMGTIRTYTAVNRALRTYEAKLTQAIAA